MHAKAVRFTAGCVMRLAHAGNVKKGQDVDLKGVTLVFSKPDFL